MRCAFIAILIFVSAAAGQTTRPATRPAISVHYDKFKDLTSLATAGIRPTMTKKAGEDQMLAMMFQYAHAGQVQKGPAALMQLVIISANSDRAFKENGPAFILLIDDRERVRLRQTNYRADFPKETTLEYVTYEITAAEFAALRSAKKIEAQIGRVEFSIAPDQLAPAAELARMIRLGEQQP